MTTKVKVKNAGLVLLSAYIPMLFERLALTENKKFKSKATQHAAVNYLQYVATGQTDTEEHLLVLNKLLSGVELQEPVVTELEVSEEQRALIEGMINAIIGHWPAIGRTSIEGFRGNWLVRDGLLSEKEDSWELTVEKRAYDLLIGKSPFSFAIIKHPWMAKPLHVNWNY